MYRDTTQEAVNLMNLLGAWLVVTTKPSMHSLIKCLESLCLASFIMLSIQTTDIWYWFPSKLNIVNYKIAILQYGIPLSRGAKYYNFLYMIYC